MRTITFGLNPAWLLENSASLDLDYAIEYGQVRSELERTGTPIGPNQSGAFIALHL
ncbi:MAG: hypothetical protein KY459_02680 [Acidobacteria bacterium]|nr:hypothetical protein [Acidobacteriota bacterium]